MKMLRHYLINIVVADGLVHLREYVGNSNAARPHQLPI